MLNNEKTEEIKKLNNFEEWFNEFKKGWQVRVIENEHLLKICFLEFLSTINKVRYIYGGQYKNVNLSSFKIQQSGTGKGVGDGFVHDLLRFLGYKVCKLNSFTEAGIIGTVSTDSQGKSNIIQGALGEYDFIWIDEARNLIVGNRHTEGLLEVINGYLDDGRIFKKLAKGEIKYWSNCNFGTGTFFFGKLKPAVLTTGLFQRTLFSYKNYSKEDVMRISKKYNGLAEKNYVNDLLPVFNKFKQMKYKLNFEKYNIGKGDLKNYVIKMNLNASEKFGEAIDNYFNEEIFEQVGDKRLQDILMSFLIRCKELGHKIMCLYAVWNQLDEIDEGCIDFSINTIKELLGHTLDFISDVFEGTKFDSDDLNKENLKTRKIRFTENAIAYIIKNNPGMTKGEFRKYVQTHRKEFMLGEQKIVQETLPGMIVDGKIKVEVGLHNETKMWINKK